MFIAVIMAGGSGKRFWPLSRENRAKQSIALFSEKTLLQETIERVLPLTNKIIVVSSIKQKKHIELDAAKYSGVKVLFEPAGRNTAPCIALALKFIEKEYGQGNKIVVLPADHYIENTDEFRNILKKGLLFVDKNPDTIGTVGITPTRAETGYGYIKKSEEVSDFIYDVEKFEAKPDSTRAESFLKSGGYLWNGGIFLFNQALMASEMESINPDIWSVVAKIKNFSSIDFDTYNSIRSISIDYAIMEKTKKKIFTIEGDFGWNDIGSWLSYYELLGKDSNGNAAKGNAEFVESSGNLVINLSSKPFFVFRKTGEFIIVAEDCMLSANLADHQEIRKITEYLEKKGDLTLL